MAPSVAVHGVPDFGAQLATGTVYMHDRDLPKVLQFIRDMETPKDPLSLVVRFFVGEAHTGWLQLDRGQFE